MANLTSILGTDLISNSYPVINTNFGNLNAESSALGTAINVLNASVVAGNPVITSIRGNTLSVITAVGDTIMGFISATMGGSATATSVAVLYNGAIINSQEFKQAAAADMMPISIPFGIKAANTTNNIVASTIAGPAPIQNIFIIAQVTK